MAKTPQALERLRTGVRTAAVRKVYIALAVGNFHTREGSFDLYFSGRYRRSKKVSVAGTGPARQLGSCKWQVLAQDTIHLPSSSSCLHVCLLRVQLIGGGQRHQIRAGLAHLDAPILGDTTYGGPAWPYAGIALHSHEVEIDNISVSSPTPPYFRVLPRALSP